MLRPATVDDYYKFYGSFPTCPESWIGLVSVGPYMIEGIGGLYWGKLDRWWACLDRAPGVKCLRDLAISSRWLVDVARSMEVDIYALPDPRIRGSEALLKRLGFEPTDETFSDIKIWRLGGENGTGNCSGNVDRERGDRGSGHDDERQRASESNEGSGESRPGIGGDRGTMG